MLRLQNRSQRAGVVAAVASALAPAAVLPHVSEDIVEGVFAGFGLTPLAAGLLVGATLTVQLLAALWAMRDHRLAYLVILLVAVVWIALAVLDHPGAFLPGEFRAGITSRVGVWALIAVQTVAGLAALRALRAGRRTSFSGTGSFTSGGTSSYGS